MPLMRQPPQIRRVIYPRIADGFRKQVRKTRIGFKQPAAMRNPISLLLNL